MNIQDGEVLFEHRQRDSSVSVIIPLYNYANYISEALDSVLYQTCRDIEIVVVDDCSSDKSVSTVAEWMEKNVDCGLNLVLAKNKRNARLAITRNTGVSYTTSKFCFFLDADNTIYPRCIERHVAALESRPDAVAAFSLIEVHGSRSALMGATVFHQNVFRHGNHVDAMAMIRRESLLQMGGFHHIDHGWEDYDLWLRLCEDDLFAIHIPEILSRYREHGASMLRTDTNLPDHIRKLHLLMKDRHPWLELH